MAKKIPADRIVISVAGDDRELFSVRERGNGDLLIALKFGWQLGPSGQAYEDVVQQRFSVHRSTRSPGCVFKQTVQTKENELTSAALVHPLNGELAWPLYAYMAPDLTDDRYRSSSRQGDSVISLGECNPTFSTLCYVLVVTDPSSAGRITPRPPFNVTRLDYEHFSIVLLHTFMCVPAIPKGWMQFAVTSKMSINGSQPTPLRADQQSPLPEEIWSAAREMIHALSHRVRRLTAEQFEREGPLPAAFTESLDVMAYVFRTRGDAIQAEPQQLVVIARDPEHAAACERLLRG